MLKPSVLGVATGVKWLVTRNRGSDNPRGRTAASCCPPHWEPKKLPAQNEGQLDTALDDAHIDGVVGEAGGVMDVELRHEMFAMPLDGLNADAEFGGSFVVGVAFGDQLKHFHLAGSQPDTFLVERSLAIRRLQIEINNALGNHRQLHRSDENRSLVTIPLFPARQYAITRNSTSRASPIPRTTPSATGNGIHPVTGGNIGLTSPA